MRYDRLAELKERHRRYCEAEDAVLSGQSYSIGELSLTRADLSEIRKAINELDKAIMIEGRKVQGLTRSRVRVVVPSDALNMTRMRRLV